MTTHASSGSVCTGPVATITSFQAPAQWRNAEQSAWSPVDKSQDFCAGDQVHIGAHGQITFLLKNNTIIKATQNSTITFTQISNESDSFIELLDGVIHVLTRVKSRFQIVTPYVNAAVDGTEFIVESGNGKARVSVLEGRVEMHNAQGSLVLAQGQSGVSERGQAPRLDLLVRPEDAVQWTLYYPPLLDYQRVDNLELDFSGLSGGEAAWREALTTSRTLAKDKQYGLALQKITDIPLTGTSAQVYSYRASLFLIQGDYDAARRDLERALQLAPEGASALALSAVVAIVQNRKDEAFELARRAYRARPEMPSTVLALSYVHQARFNIATARSHMEAAAPDFPQNALIWSRYAELLLMEGQLEAAERAANRAYQIDAHLGRVHSVRGYTQLSRFRMTDAQASFENAIRDDDRDPLPRLGLALTLIQQGNMAAGREQLEIAASLDPQNALIRSYLGKAYADEGRSKRALDQFALAKERDPKDPTPWLYEALLLQSENRPVDALRALQEAIALNQNRAVYRSQFLLDNDLATRSASLGRVYRDLGFDESAQREAVNSLAIDPTNPSAHRLLADAFRNSSRYQVTRASELFQSQLLQSYNSAPLQSELAGETAAVVEGAGPSNPGFNEYQPLFTRSGTRFYLNQLGGDLGTQAQDAQLSTLYGSTSSGLGLSHYATRGYRPNNDYRHDTQSVLVQQASTTRDNLLISHRREQFDLGDISQSLIPENYSFALRRERTRESTVAAARHAVNENQQLLMMFASYKGSEKFHDSIPQTGGPLLQPTVSTDNRTQSFELAIKHKLDGAYLQAGGGAARSDNEADQKAKLVLPVVTINALDKQYRYGIQHSIAHLILNGPLTDTLKWTAGFSYDDRRESTRITNSLTNTTEPFYSRRSQLNPKLGLSWQASESTVVRTAFFRTLKREFQNNITLEPTVINGFVQYQDDTTLVDNKNSAISIDTQFDRNTAFGLSGLFQRRSMPFFLSAPYRYERQRWENQVLHGYLNRALSPKATLNASFEYQDEFRFGPTIQGSLFPRTLYTQTAQLAWHYFATPQLDFRIGVRYIKQAGGFVNTQDVVDRRYHQEFAPIDVETSLTLNRKLRLQAGVKNLRNEHFNYQRGMYQPVESVQADYIPQRYLYTQISLALD